MQSKLRYKVCRVFNNSEYDIIKVIMTFVIKALAKINFMIISIKKQKRTEKGFTLIELLVVISIISLLSSVILVSLSTARAKAKDSVIVSALHEMRNLMELNYSTNQSYEQLQVGWVGSAIGDCETKFSSAGIYKDQAIVLCKKILANSIQGAGGPTQRYHTGVFNNGMGRNKIKYFSIMAWLSNGKNYCVGSSGISSNGIYYISTIDDIFVEPLDIARHQETPVGCYYNP